MSSPCCIVAPLRLPNLHALFTVRRIAATLLVLVCFADGSRRDLRVHLNANVHAAAEPHLLQTLEAGVREFLDSIADKHSCHVSVHASAAGIPTPSNPLRIVFHDFLLIRLETDARCLSVQSSQALNAVSQEVILHLLKCFGEEKTMRVDRQCAGGRLVLGSGAEVRVRTVVPDRRVAFPRRHHNEPQKEPTAPTRIISDVRPPTNNFTAGMVRGRHLLQQGEALDGDGAISDEDNDDRSSSGDVVYPVDALSMEALWAQFPNAMGQGVHVAMLDTGLSTNNPHFAGHSPLIASCMSFTDETPPNGASALSWCADGHGHGTFGASLVAGGAGVGTQPRGHGGCRDPSKAVPSATSKSGPNMNGRFVGGVGIAPKVTLHIFKVFTDTQVSLTSWVLAAFDMAVQLHVDVINLSFGGMDYYDDAFVEKVRDVTAAGVTIVTASGNDGPRHGSVFNPADQAEVVAVGSVRYDNRRTQHLTGDFHHVSRFSSRGATAWEFPFGVGRPRPDVLSLGEKVIGASSMRAKRTCRTLSGTSMASPVVAGALAVISSAIKSLEPSTILPLDERGRTRVNAALLKQILYASADSLSLRSRTGDRQSGSLSMRRLREVSLFSQGAGVVNVSRALRHIWISSTSRGFSSLQQPGAEGIDRMLRLSAYPERVVAVTNAAFLLREYDNPSTPSVPTLWQRFLSEDLFAASGAQRTAVSHHIGTEDAPYVWPNVLRAHGVFATSSPLLVNTTLYLSGAPTASFVSYDVGFDDNATALLLRSTRAGGPAAASASTTTTSLSSSTAEMLLNVVVDVHRPLLEAHVGYVTIAFWTPISLPERTVRVRVRGTVSLHYASETRGNGAVHRRRWSVGVPFVVDVTQPPERRHRLLWDTTAQLLYPSAYIPRDNIREQRFSDFAEWGGDHPTTNFVHLYEHLVMQRGLVVDLVHHSGFYAPLFQGRVKVADDDLRAKPTRLAQQRGEIMCHLGNSSLLSHAPRYLTEMYGYLLVVDPEDYFDDDFLRAVVCSVRHYGLRLLLASDWAHEGVMRHAAFVDPATHIFHEPVTGGANVRAVNSLVRPFGVVQSDHCVVSGPLRGADDRFLASVSSGGCIAAVPVTPDPTSGSRWEMSRVDAYGCSINARELHDDAAELKQLASADTSKKRRQSARIAPPLLWADVHPPLEDPPYAFVVQRFCAPAAADMTHPPEAAVPKRGRTSMRILAEQQLLEIPRNGEKNCGGIFFFADSECLDGMHHHEAGGAPSSHVFCTRLLDAAFDVLDHGFDASLPASAILGLHTDHCKPFSSDIGQPSVSPLSSWWLNESVDFGRRDPLFFLSRRYRLVQEQRQGCSNVTQEASPRGRGRVSEQLRPPLRCPMERWATEEALGRLLDPWLQQTRHVVLERYRASSAIRQHEEARSHIPKVSHPSNLGTMATFGFIVFLVGLMVLRCWSRVRRALLGRKRRGRKAIQSLTSVV